MMHPTLKTFMAKIGNKLSIKKDMFFVLMAAILTVELLLWACRGLGLIMAHKYIGFNLVMIFLVIVAALILTVSGIIVSVVRHHRLQFNLRAIFLFVLVIAIPLGWWSQEIKQLTERRKAVEEIINLRGFIRYGNELVFSDLSIGDSISLNRESPPIPRWLQKWLGEDAFVDVNYVDLSQTTLGDEKLHLLKQFPRLMGLDLTGTQVTDGGLNDLNCLSELEDLRLSETKISDTGLKKINKLKKMRFLDLSRTSVGDSGLSNLKELKDLVTLRLDSTNISNSGLEYLYDLGQLQDVFIDRTHATNSGVQELKRRLPRCYVDGPGGEPREHLDKSDDAVEPEAHFILPKP
ncbi:MAG: hypothetical protein K8T25_20355 [Planctomycetia bacterium]|nr:hypothetical protein [Planctomycetia bacterium]